MDSSVIPKPFLTLRGLIPLSVLGPVIAKHGNLGALACDNMFNGCTIGFDRKKCLNLLSCPTLTPLRVGCLASNYVICGLEQDEPYGVI